MPVVIKELIITATVETPAGRPAATAGAEAGVPAAPQLGQLVQRCVSQVLAVLREQAER